jgi:sugar/nucleoside kinase (ribokinase family)
MLTYLGAIAQLRAEHVERQMVARARHLHVGSYFLLDGLRPGLAGLFAEARGLGLTTSLDTNWDPREEWQLGGLLNQCDLLLPNEAEARQLAGGGELEEALERLAGRVGTVAVKKGAAGAIARRGDEVARQEPRPAAVVDTVGAGDSFNAGFLYGFLKRWTLERSLGLAVACGSLSTRAAGGTAAQPTLDEALAWL